MSIIIRDESQNGYKYISGIAFNGIPRYKVGENDVRAGQFYVVNKEGKPEEVDFLIYFYDNVQIYIIKFFDGPVGYYRITGQAIPADSTIGISKNFDGNDIKTLTNEENLQIQVETNTDEALGELGSFLIEEFFKDEEA
jgi:hypothetical protein